MVQAGAGGPAAGNSPPDLPSPLRTQTEREKARDVNIDARGGRTILQTDRSKPLAQDASLEKGKLRNLSKEIEDGRKWKFQK